ncbi:glycosyltransferase [Pseudanabaenaceae cyanobacterium LEGE 13415]|nr:glycosyltransferase [Pseudanabaenaceae cyanobacterium LEGE 13415]
MTSERAPICALTAPERPTLGNLLMIAADFPPETVPIANRAANLLKYLKQDWNIRVLTATQKGEFQDIPVEYSRPLPNGLNWLDRIKLDKIVNWLVYPDDRIFWIVPALFKALQLIRQQKPDVVVVMMMPYSAGLIGVAIKWLTKIPLVLNLDDSPTCVDMHPIFPSRLHYQIARWLEDFYIRQADSIIYVSHRTVEAVKARQSIEQRSKLKLIRCGVDSNAFQSRFSDTRKDSFDIVYVGGMNGWHEFYRSPKATHPLKHWYDRWTKFGQYVQAQINYSSSSPMFIGAAIQQVLQQHPEWQGKVRIRIYGNRYPHHVVQQALSNQNLQEIVSVSDALPHAEAVQIAQQADLLLIALPDRDYPNIGGRISVKTYEYLMSDRPILAAIPKGENWDYLENKPGVWRVPPRDVEAMAKVIEQLVAKKFAGQHLSYDRRSLHQQLSYKTLGATFSEVLQSVLRN